MEKKGLCPKRTLFFMKLLPCCLVLFCTMAGKANRIGTQTTPEKKITISLRNELFKTALRKIGEMAAVSFSYARNTLPENERVTLTANNESLNAVLNKLFAPYHIHFEIIGQQVVLKKEEAASATTLASPGHFNLITGTVKDADGQLIADVSIAVKGSAKGTYTNNAGQFSLDANDNDTLVFSAIGYITSETPVQNQAALNIVLKKSDKKLDDVVVVGYGTQRRKDLTGAISSVKLENSPLQTLPNVNVLDALKGSVAGFDIGAVTAAGSNPGFTIRGQNSIRAETTPLIIVDGVIFLGSFNEINPQDIASVDILKDASSTAVYGALAANGVILITTKRGKTDKPTIQLNITGGLQTYTNRPHMRSTDAYLQMRKDRYLTDNPAGTYDTATNLAPYELEAYRQGQTIDWFKEVTQVAPLQNYNLSVSGSTTNSSYYLSGNYMNQEGIVVGDQFHKFSILAKIETRIASWLKLGVTLNAISKNADGVAADFQNGTILSPYGFKNVHDRGTLAPGFGDFTSQMERYPQGQTTTSNPLWNTQQFNRDRNQNYRSTSFARINVPWIKGLTYTFNYALNRWEGHSANFQNERMFINTMLLSDLQNTNIQLANANGTKQNTQRTDWYMNHLINYSIIKGAHAIDATLLSEKQSQQSDAVSIAAKDFSTSGSTVLGVNALELGNPANYTTNTSYTQLHQMAAMARVNYVYGRRYHASFSIRQDGYSGYAEGHKYGVFRAGAIAWTASEEAFIKHRFTFLDNLKFRVSFGENGNPSVGAYSTFPTINSTGTILLGGTTQRIVYAANLANKNLDWEKTTALNIGMDFSIFNNLLSGSVNVYNSNTTDLLLARSIPIINGFTTVLDNIGKVNNKGVEVELVSTNYTSKNLTWKTGLNYWINRNKVVQLYGLDANKDGKQDDDPASSLFIGRSLGANYTYVMDGIIQKTDAKYMAIYGGQPGDIKFKDLNSDGKIDATNDRAIVGYSKPNFTVTLSNTLYYKNFTLYFLINHIAGGGKDNWYVGNNAYAYLPNALYGGTSANWLNKQYWTPDNPSNSVTRINYNNAAYNYQFPKSRAFTRLQDVSISYNLPASLLTKAHITNVQVFASGKNLLTISSWEGLDPESGTPFASTTGYPVFRIFNFGVNVSF